MRLTKLIRFVTVLFVALSIVCIAFAVATLHMRQIATVVVIVLNSLVGIAGLLMIYRKVSPIGKLARVVEDVAAGNINLNRDKSLLTKDEIGEISASVYKFTDTVKQMTGDFSSLNAEIHDAGNFTYRIDESVYDGSFKEIVGDANIMVNRFAGDVLAFMDTLTELTDGNFDVRCKQLPGQKAILSQKIEAMSSMLYKVDTEITTLTKSAIKGDLTVRSNVENFSGGWKLLLQNLNELFQAVVEQANWYESILDSIPTPISVTDLDMNWTFINRATEMILGKSRNDVKGQPCHKWGAAICNTPNCGVACVKRGIEQTTFEQFGRNFQVNVAYLKNLAGEKAGHVEVVQDTSRLAEYIKKIDKIMAETKSISDQVSEGARQISVSSQSLASGASSQASAIEELNASIETINSQTHQTAETARNASGLSERAQEHAIKGNEEMSRMVTAMEGIKDATGNIAKIIGTIESIAFQTNLLALNASVEAARAGEHGKGFSVVADEVRTLASRSKNAAQDTNALIFDTTSKVEEGTKIALATAHSFNEIVSDFQTVSKIIHDIASASVEQADSIGQISAGISQIAEITQQNSATSEESAAASEELASQSESLTNMFDGM